MSHTFSVELENQPIELCKLLKVANLVNGGGEAKVVISEGYVAVNGEIEFQKRKKIYHQDVVEFNGDFIEVVCHSPFAAPQSKSATKNSKSTTKSKAAPATQKQTQRNAQQPSGKRKKISF